MGINGELPKVWCDAKCGEKVGPFVNAKRAEAATQMHEASCGRCLSTPDPSSAPEPHMEKPPEPMVGDTWEYCTDHPDYEDLNGETRRIVSISANGRIVGLSDEGHERGCAVAFLIEHARCISRAADDEPAPKKTDRSGCLSWCGMNWEDIRSDGRGREVNQCHIDGRCYWVGDHAEGGLHWCTAKCRDERRPPIANRKKTPAAGTPWSKWPIRNVPPPANRDELLNGRWHVGIDWGYTSDAQKAETAAAVQERVNEHRRLIAKAASTCPNCRVEVPPWANHVCVQVPAAANRALRKQMKGSGEKLKRVGASVAEMGPSAVAKAPGARDWMMGLCDEWDLLPDA